MVLEICPEIDDIIISGSNVLAVCSCLGNRLGLQT